MIVSQSAVFIFVVAALLIILIVLALGGPGYPPSGPGGPPVSSSAGPPTSSYPGIIIELHTTKPSLNKTLFGTYNW